MVGTTLFDDSTNSGATTNAQTNTSGSNTLIQADIRQKLQILTNLVHNNTTAQNTNAYTGDSRVVNSASYINVSNVAKLCVVGISVVYQSLVSVFRWYI